MDGNWRNKSSLVFHCVQDTFFGRGEEFQSKKLTWQQTDLFWKPHRAQWRRKEKKNPKQIIGASSLFLPGSLWYKQQILKSWNNRKWRRSTWKQNSSRWAFLNALSLDVFQTSFTEPWTLQLLHREALKTPLQSIFLTDSAMMCSDGGVYSGWAGAPCGGGRWKAFWDLACGPTCHGVFDTCRGAF